MRQNIDTSLLCLNKYPSRTVGKFVIFFIHLHSLVKKNHIKVKERVELSPLQGKGLVLMQDRNSDELGFLVFSTV